MIDKLKQVINPGRQKRSRNNEAVPEDRLNKKARVVNDAKDNNEIGEAISYLWLKYPPPTANSKHATFLFHSFVHWYLLELSPEYLLDKEHSNIMEQQQDEQFTVIEDDLGIVCMNALHGLLFHTDHPQSLLTTLLCDAQDALRYALRFDKACSTTACTPQRACGTHTSRTPSYSSFSNLENNLCFPTKSIQMALNKRFFGHKRIQRKLTILIQTLSNHLNCGSSTVRALTEAEMGSLAQETSQIQKLPKLSFLHRMVSLIPIPNTDEGLYLVDIPPSVLQFLWLMSCCVLSRGTGMSSKSDKGKEYKMEIKMVIYGLIERLHRVALHQTRTWCHTSISVEDPHSQVRCRIVRSLKKNLMRCEDTHYQSCQACATPLAALAEEMKMPLSESIAPLDRSNNTKDQWQYLSTKIGIQLYLLSLYDDYAFPLSDETRHNISNALNWTPPQGRLHSPYPNPLYITNSSSSSLVIHMTRLLCGSISFSSYSDVIDAHSNDALNALCDEGTLNTLRSMGHALHECDAKREMSAIELGTKTPGRHRLSLRTGDTVGGGSTRLKRLLSSAKPGGEAHTCDQEGIDRGLPNEVAPFSLQWLSKDLRKELELSTVAQRKFSFGPARQIGDAIGEL